MAPLRFIVQNGGLDWRWSTPLREAHHENCSGLGLPPHFQREDSMGAPALGARPRLSLFATTGSNGAINGLEIIASPTPQQRGLIDSHDADSSELSGQWSGMAFARK